MTETNLKDFLTNGAFLQTGPDLYKVLIGPFERCSLKHLTNYKQFSALYKPDFWDFLQESTGTGQNNVYIPANSLSLNREEFIHFLSKCTSQKPDIFWGDINEMQFRTQFDWSQNNFSMQELIKSVPIICQNGNCNFNFASLNWCLQNIIQNKNFGWSYGFFEDGKGILGHSPEVLTQWTRGDRQLHTVALAGTYKKTEEAYDKILSDEKILNEHQVVIEDIVNKLSDLSFKSKSQHGPTDILELKYLLHLITEFQLEANDIGQVFEVIEALHPTAAMGLYPNSKQKFKEFYNFSLQKERSGFAAPFAIVEEEMVCCVVAIRNIIFSSQQVKIFSGCGVTSASEYRSELTELQNKRDSVKKMLGLNVD